MALPASRPTRTKVVVVLPGILSTPLEKVGPVLKTISKNADIAGIDYGTGEIDVDGIAANTANLIKDLADKKAEVTMMGISVGGLLVPFVMRYLAMMDGDPTKALKKNIIIDAPHGADTMIPLPAFARWVFTKKAYRALNGPVGDWLLDHIVVPPKDENIEVPADVKDPVAHKAAVKERALYELRGHEWSMYGSQNDLMAGLMPRLSILNTVPTTYVACVSKKNDTVKQPLALERWLDEVPTMEVVKVDTAHAAFLEAPITWNEVMDDLINK